MQTIKRKSGVFLLLYIGYVFIYVARLNMTMASPALRAGNYLTEVELGFIGSAFSVIYSCGRLFNGVIGDRLAPWILITTGLLLTGLSNLLLGFLPAYILILLLWCINAFAQSMLWSSILRYVTGLYDKAGADKKVSILVSSVSVGNILGILLGSWTVSNLGVHAAFLVPGTLTVLTGLTSAYVLRKAPQGPKPQKQRFPFGEFVRNKKIRGVLLPAMFHGVMKDNISLWMAVYFFDQFAVDLERSSWYVLLIPTVGLVGRLLYPVCYRLSRRRGNLIATVSFVLCAVLSGVLCLQLRSPLLAAVCLSLIYAFVSMINTSFLSILPLQFTRQNMVSSVSGLMDFVTYLGAAIGSAIYGFLIADYGYLPMFLSWAAISVLALLFMAFQHPLTSDAE